MEYRLAVAEEEVPTSVAEAPRTSVAVGVAPTQPGRAEQAVAPSNRRSLTVRNAISISLRWRNNIDANQETLP